MLDFVLVGGLPVVLPYWYFSSWLCFCLLSCLEEFNLLVSLPREELDPFPEMDLPACVRGFLRFDEVVLHLSVLLVGLCLSP